MGWALLQELARIAPHIMYLFKRPKGIQATQFIAVVDALVTFAREPSTFFEGFRALTVRSCRLVCPTRVEVLMPCAQPCQPQSCGPSYVYMYLCMHAYVYEEKLCKVAAASQASSHLPAHPIIL